MKLIVKMAVIINILMALIIVGCNGDPSDKGSEDISSKTNKDDDEEKDYESADEEILAILGDYEDEVLDDYEDQTFDIDDEEEDYENADEEILDILNDYEDEVLDDYEDQTLDIVNDEDENIEVDGIKDELLDEYQQGDILDSIQILNCTVPLPEGSEYIGQEEGQVYFTIGNQFISIMSEDFGENIELEIFKTIIEAEFASDNSDTVIVSSDIVDYEEGRYGCLICQNETSEIKYSIATYKFVDNTVFMLMSACKDDEELKKSKEDFEYMIEGIQ